MQAKLQRASHPRATEGFPPIGGPGPQMVNLVEMQQTDMSPAETHASPASQVGCCRDAHPHLGCSTRKDRYTSTAQHRCAQGDYCSSHQVSIHRRQVNVNNANKSTAQAPDLE